VQRWITVIIIVGVLALTAYGAVGETGPIGWLNGMQATNTGGYSRVLSLFILFIGIGIVVVPLLVAAVMVRDRFLGAPPVRKPFEDVPLFPPRPAGAKPRGFWRTSLVVLLVLMALSWGGTLGWHAWDWHRRAGDAGSDYPLLRLGRDMPAPARPAAGSHLKLAGRPLWDRALVRHEGKTHASSDDVFLPVGGADWQAGDPVHIVIRLAPSGVFALRHRADGADAPLWIRVEGAVPGATLPVFRQGRSPVSDDAVLVRTVTPQGGPPTEVRPAFDRDAALQVGGGLSGFLAVLWLTAVVSLKAKAWMLRRAGGRGVSASRT